VRNVMLDHLSIAWGVWDNLSLWTNDGAFRNVTIAWSIVAEPLSTVNSAVNANISAANPELADASTDVDFHHNLFTGASHRNPLHGIRSGRIVNNAVYNWSHYATRVKGYKDVVGNYYRPGPYTRGSAPTRPIHAWTTQDGNCTTDDPSLFVAGNVSEVNAGPGAVDEWADLTALVANQSTNEDGAVRPIPERYRRATPLCSSGGTASCTPVGTPGAPITVDPAQSLVDPGGEFLRTVGASRRLDCEGRWVAARDAVDSRLVDEFVGRGGPARPPRDEADAGGFPALSAGEPCADRDGDGMPDAFEDASGLDPADPRDASATAPDGYTWLEHYLDGA
jgi:hypothetical protein